MRAQMGQVSKQLAPTWARKHLPMPWQHAYTMPGASQALKCEKSSESAGILSASMDNSWLFNERPLVKMSTVWGLCCFTPVSCGSCRTYQRNTCRINERSKVIKTPRQRYVLSTMVLVIDTQSSSKTSVTWLVYIKSLCCSGTYKGRVVKTPSNCLSHKLHVLLLEFDSGPETHRDWWEIK